MPSKTTNYIPFGHGLQEKQHEHGKKEGNQRAKKTREEHGILSTAKGGMTLCTT
jgi:hypothetical protein